MDSHNRLIADIARSQHGVFTRAQALSTGVGDRTIRSRIASGVYERLYPEVYGFPGAVATWHRDVAAAVFSAMPPAAASHMTAAYLWGMTDARAETIEVACRRHQRVHRGRFRLHESKDLKAFDIVAVEGVPVTSPVRTVVDLGASAPLGTVARCLDAGLRMELFNLQEVRPVHRTSSETRKDRSGYDSTPCRREIVLGGTHRKRPRRPVQGTRPSICSAHARATVRTSETNRRLCGPIRLWLPTAYGLIELDSERWHMGPESFQNDREKQNRAHALGWTVYRFTWRQLRQEPSHVISTLAYITAK